jgi:DNA-binding NtrC family response regulator
MWLTIQSLLARVAWLVRKGNPVCFRRVARPQKRASAAPLAIVGLVLNPQDRRLLAGLGSRNQWDLRLADTVEEAQVLSGELSASVILCDRDAAGAAWWQTVQALSSHPHRPCILLLSTVVDDYLWNEVVRRGGYDVLPKPLREEDVVRAIKLAGAYQNTSTHVAAPGSSAAAGLKK